MKIIILEISHKIGFCNVSIAVEITPLPRIIALFFLLAAFIFFLRLRQIRRRRRRRDPISLVFTRTIVPIKNQETKVFPHGIYSWRLIVAWLHLTPCIGHGAPRDGRERSASTKGLVSNRRQRVGQRDGRERGAAEKGHVPNRFKRVGQRDGRERVAVLKGPVPNRRERVGQRDGREG